MAKSYTCERCEFWDRDYIENDRAACRRNAPTRMWFEVSGAYSGLRHATWPQTRRNDWCGEFDGGFRL